MNVKELRTMSEVELEKLVKKNQEALRDLRFKAASGQLKTVREIRRVRKEIARIHTILGQKVTNEN